MTTAGYFLSDTSTDWSSQLGSLSLELLSLGQGQLRHCFGSVQRLYSMKVTMHDKERL